MQGASRGLPAKVVTQEDAEGVQNAEKLHNLGFTTHPGGVAESVTRAARVNQRGVNMS